MTYSVQLTLLDYLDTWSDLQIDVYERFGSVWLIVIYP